MTREEWEAKQNALKKQFKYVSTGKPGEVNKVEIPNSGNPSTIRQGEVKKIYPEEFNVSGGALNLGQTPILKEDPRSSTRKSKSNPLASIYKNNDEADINKANPRFEGDEMGLNKIKANVLLGDASVKNLSQSDIDIIKSQKDKFYKSDEFKQMQNKAIKEGHSAPSELDTDSFQAHLDNLSKTNLDKYIETYKGLSPASVINLSLNR